MFNVPTHKIIIKHKKLIINFVSRYIRENNCKILFKLKTVKRNNSQ